MPIVSIITPAFNAEKYIARTIDSVLSQSFKDWEMIIIDDNSIDGTEQIVLSYQYRERRIKYIKLTENCGAVKARNFGIEHAKGRFISFLDSDDIWMPNKLDIQLDFMSKNKLSFSYTYYYANYDGIRILRKGPRKLNYSNLLRKCYIGCLTVMYDTQYLGKRYMPSFSKRHDWALWLQILKEIDAVHGIPIPLAEYTIRRNSLSAQKVGLIKYNWAVFRLLEGENIESYYKFSVFLIINTWFTFREKIIFFYIKKRGMLIRLK